LNRIPYSQACVAIYIHKQKSKAYLDEYYMIDKYMQGNATRVYGMQGPNTWPSDDPCDSIMLPIIKRALRRPKIARRRAANEPISPYKLTCSGYVVKCENCEGLGHNYKGCQLPLNPDRKKVETKEI
jgi:hypothetical protein